MSNYINFSSHLQNPSHYEDFNERGVIFLNNGNYGRALQEFNHSIKLCANTFDNPAAYYNRGMTYEKLGRMDEAINDMKTVSSSGSIPIIYLAYANLGSMYMELQDWHQAINAFRRVADFGKYPDYPQTREALVVSYHNLGVCLRNVGKFEEAIQSLNKGIELDNSDIDFFLTLAEIYNIIEQPDMALRTCKLAHDLDSNSPVIYWLMTHAFLQQEKFDKAIQSLETFKYLKGSDLFGNHDQVALMLAELTLKSSNQKPVDSEKVSKIPVKAKIAVARELMQKKEFEAARAILEFIETAISQRYLDELNRVQLANSLKTGVLGLLEEWLQGNSIIGDAKKYVLRDATTYLKAKYSKELTDELVNQLRLRKAFNNLVLDGTELSGTNLSSLNCVNAKFIRANLAGVNLSGSDCTYAAFTGANMAQIIAIKTSFYEAHLLRASLYAANLQNANFANADLSQADLKEANLAGANLKSAILENANLKDAKFSVQTILPDGSYWNPNIDMSKYTNPTSDKSFATNQPSPQQSQVHQSMGKPIAPAQPQQSSSVEGPIGPMPPPSKPTQTRRKHDEYYDWLTSQELDQWDSDSDSFVGNHDGTGSWWDD